MSEHNPIENYAECIDKRKLFEALDQRQKEHENRRNKCEYSSDNWKYHNAKCSETHNIKLDVAEFESVKSENIISEYIEELKDIYGNCLGDGKCNNCQFCTSGKDCMPDIVFEGMRHDDVEGL